MDTHHEDLDPVAAPPDAAVPEPEARPEPQPEPRPAIVIGPIIFHSRTTPVIGLMMLAIGLMTGYWGRPMVGQTAVAEVRPTPAAPAEAEAVAEGNDQIMQVVVADTRHFLGDPAAPVTLIEFSDFQ